MNTRTIALATASTLLVLGLTSGCAAIPPLGVGGGGLAEKTIEDTIEEATGTSVDIGDSVAVPDGWPDLPLPDGMLIASVAIDRTYSLDYQLSDEAPTEATRDALVAEGYEVTAESLGELNIWVAANPEWTVSLSWYKADDGTVRLTYAATPTPAP